MSLNSRPSLIKNLLHSTICTIKETTSQWNRWKRFWQIWRSGTLDFFLGIHLSCDTFLHLPSSRTSHCGWTAGNSEVALHCLRGNALHWSLRAGWLEVRTRHVVVLKYLGSRLLKCRMVCRVGLRRDSLFDFERCVCQMVLSVFNSSFFSDKVVLLQWWALNQIFKWRTNQPQSLYQQVQLKKNCVFKF